MELGCCLFESNRKLSITNRFSMKIYIFFFGILFVSCTLTSNNDNYPKNSNISDYKGKPKDSLTLYFPTVIQRDSQKINIEIDSSRLKWYTSALYMAKEPILYNYYLGHSIYRLLWLGSFDKPVILSLNKDGRKVWLNVKKLDRQPNYLNMRWKVLFTPPEVTDENGKTFSPDLSKWEELPIDSIYSKENRTAKIIYNQTKELTVKEWKEFETLLQACSFWTTHPFQRCDGFDGALCLIEGHLKDKYWYVDKWSPRDDFRKAGKYLIAKSGLNERIY